MSFKYALLTLVWLSLSFCLAAESNLGVFVDVKRFLDTNKQTEFNIDYEIPYKNLLFKTRAGGYFAELKVTVNFAYPDSEQFQLLDEFTNNIGVSKKIDLSSPNKSYLDRIPLTLSKSGYRLRINFEDINARKSYTWSYTMENLKPDDLCSDLELIRMISSEQNMYAQKFLRDSKHYIPETTGIVNKSSADSLFIFCELYLKPGLHDSASLVISKDSTDVLIVNQFREQFQSDNQIVFPLNVDNLEPGKYSATLALKSEQGSFTRSTLFYISEQVERQYFIFTDPEEEYQFIRKFAPGKSSVNWSSLTKEAKRNYISNFWISLASEQGNTTEAVLDVYKQRIDYCNARFSHFEKGWKTDMGRIYIRNGAPDEIDNDTSSDETRFVRKDYQIWKYTGNNHPVYVFVDIPMNGNFKLVYAANDEQESTNPNWKNYLGKDFDESRLEN